MAADADPRTAAGAKQWMQRTGVLQRPEPPPGVFEIALSLGGTVSAGAYTAGVLDFLVEALDQWDAARAAGAGASHRVRLHAVTGTSGGGACAALLAKTLAHSFAPEAISDPAAGPNLASKNPLYRSWVLGFNFEQMCRVPETAAPPLTALLHRGPLTNPVELPLAPPRGWVADPLTVGVTLTNLTGIPYRVSFAGDASRGEGYTRHADYARLEFFYRKADDGALCWPDAVRVKAQPGADTTGHAAAIELSWDEAWSFVRGTSAFPVVFPTVDLERPAWHYLYQPIVVPRPTEDGGIVLDPAVLQPAWIERGQDPTGMFRFVAADGGILNNSPIELARRALAGVAGTNPRAPDTARRAVIHVDPLASPAAAGAARSRPLVETAGATLSALLGHARYSTQDFLLAAEPEGRSRFLVGAVRTADGQRIEGSAAVAGGALGGFSAFFSAAYRHHDFMLGRRNCQRFLRRHLTLSAANPSFEAPGGDDERPAIPLVGSAAAPQPQPVWPAGRFEPGDASAGLRARLRYMLALALPAVGPRLVLAFVLLLPRSLGARILANALASRGVKAIRRSLHKHKLSPDC